MLAEFATAVTLSLAPAVADEAISVDPPPVGARYGTISIPRIGIKMPMIQGTSQKQLARGVSHLARSYLPGMGGTIALFGHRVTPTLGLPHGPFYDINLLKRGTQIILRMPYGTYKYRVVKRKIIGPRDWRQFRPQLKQEKLVMAACHPKGSAAKRYTITAVRQKEGT